MSGRGDLAVWSVEGGDPLASIPRPDSPVKSYAVGGDHDCLLILHEDGTASLSDSGTGHVIGILQAPAVHASGPASAPPATTAPSDNRLVAVAFSPDGREVWAITSRHQVVTWPAHGSLAGMIRQTRAEIARCLSLDERARMGLDSVIPRWCADLGKSSTASAEFFN